jgi:hypothetical protein
MAADELGAGRLLDDDVNDVLTVEVVRVPEERLFAVVMVFRDPTPVMIKVINADSGSIAKEKLMSSEPIRTISQACE